MKIETDITPLTIEQTAELISRALEGSGPLTEEEIRAVDHWANRVLIDYTLLQMLMTGAASVHVSGTNADEWKWSRPK